MDFHKPYAIKLNETTQGLLKDIDSTAIKVNEFRPLSTHMVDNILRDLLGDRVYSSNAIEGNPLDLRETKQLLMAGQTAARHGHAAAEVVNLGKALDFAHKSLVCDNEAHQASKLLQVHKLLLTGINDGFAGRFRTEDVMINGAKYQPPDHGRVASYIDEMFAELSTATNIHPLIKATWVHWAIARIHPFFDGNGRIARLWQDIVLFQERLTCAIVRPSDRTEYYNSLQLADDGDFNPLVQFVAQGVASTFDKYLLAQQQDTALNEWASQLIHETDMRAAEDRKLKYLRWSRKMEELRYAFERCAAKLANVAEHIEIQFRPYEIIDQTKWEGIASGTGASMTWLFKLSFSKQQQFLTYIFFFGKHFWTEQDSDLERAEPRVCLLISEGSGEGEAVRLDEHPATPLSLRQVFIVNDKFVRIRIDASSGSEVYDREVTPTTIAQDFIKEVLLSRVR